MVDQASLPGPFWDSSAAEVRKRAAGVISLLPPDACKSKRRIGSHRQSTMWVPGTGLPGQDERPVQSNRRWPANHLRGGNSAIASFARTPPVIEIGANGALLASSALEIMIWSNRVASWSTEAAKTSRPKWHHRIAP